MSRTEDEADLGGEDLGDFLAAEGPAWPPAEFLLELRRPITFKEETFSVLSLREPTGGEWEEIFDHPTKTRRRFAVSRIAGIPMGAAALIGIGDLVRADNYLASFFEVGQKISDW